MVIQLSGRRSGDRRRRLVENAVLMVPCSFNIHRPSVLDLTPNPRGDKASKRPEGMPAFGSPVLSFILLVVSFLFRIYWIKPSIFGREGRCVRLGGDSQP